MVWRSESVALRCVHVCIFHIKPFIPLIHIQHTTCHPVSVPVLQRREVQALWHLNTNYLSPYYETEIGGGIDRRCRQAGRPHLSKPCLCRRYVNPSRATPRFWRQPKALCSFVGKFVHLLKLLRQRRGLHEADLETSRCCTSTQPGTGKTLLVNKEQASPTLSPEHGAGQPSHQHHF